MFISKIFVVFFTLLVGSALAAPVYTERPLDDLQLSTRGLGHMAKAVRIALRIKKRLRPTPGKSVFWSGTRPSEHEPVSVDDDAQNFAKAHGKEVLASTLEEHGINIPSHEENPYSSKMWDIASKTFAQRTSGHVHAILGSTRRPGNVYDTIEKPTLMKNKKVTKLTEYNAETWETTVVKGE
jgi:hypothetical protein